MLDTCKQTVCHSGSSLGSLLLYHAFWTSQSVPKEFTLRPRKLPQQRYISSYFFPSRPCKDCVLARRDLLILVLSSAMAVCYEVYLLETLCSCAIRLYLRYLRPLSLSGHEDPKSCVFSAYSGDLRVVVCIFKHRGNLTWISVP
jgi:hypothetical protein